MADAIPTSGARKLQGTYAQMLAHPNPEASQEFYVLTGPKAGAVYEHGGTSKGWRMIRAPAGGAIVSDSTNVPGIARNRFVSAITGVLPVNRSSVVTITIATPGVVSWTSHGLADGTPIKLSTTGALPTGLVADTTYYVVAGAASTLQLAATPGGAAIATSGTQSGVHTAVGNNGVAQWSAPGVLGVEINSVIVVSGTLPTAANTNFAVRLAIDSENDAVDALLLPVAVNAPNSLLDVGQVKSFNLTPVWNGTSFSLILDRTIYIDVNRPITRLALIHNIGTALVLQFLISAVEEE